MQFCIAHPLSLGELKIKRILINLSCSIDFTLFQIFALISFFFLNFFKTAFSATVRIQVWLVEAQITYPMLPTAFPHLKTGNLPMKKCLPLQFHRIWSSKPLLRLCLSWITPKSLHRLREKYLCGLVHLTTPKNSKKRDC